MTGSLISSTVLAVCRPTGNLKMYVCQLKEQGWSIFACILCCHCYPSYQSLLQGKGSKNMMNILRLNVWPIRNGTVPRTCKRSKTYLVKMYDISWSCSKLTSWLAGESGLSSQQPPEAKTNSFLVIDTSMLILSTGSVRCGNTHSLSNKYIIYNYKYLYHELRSALLVQCYYYWELSTSCVGKHNSKWIMIRKK